MRGRSRLGGKFWTESAVALVAAALAVLTFIEPDWIEEVFHIDPDSGSGVLEWAIVVGLALLALASALLARLEWRRLRLATG